MGFLELCGWRRALVLRQKGISGYDDFSTEEEEEEEVTEKFSEYIGSRCKKWLAGRAGFSMR